MFRIKLVCALFKPVASCNALDTVGDTPAVTICKGSISPLATNWVTALPTALSTPAGRLRSASAELTALEATCPNTGATPPAINPFVNSPPVVSDRVPL